MQYEERKTLATLLATRNMWREIYCQTDRAVRNASSNRGGWEGRHPNPGVSSAEWLNLINANGNAHIEIRDAELEIKRVASKIMKNKSGGSKDELDRVLGYNFDEEETPWNAANPLVLPNPLEGDRIPVLSYQVAGEYVHTRGSEVVRSISGFSTGDVLMRAGFHPRAFSTSGARRYRVPAMIWQLGTGEWIGIDSVSVGYGGTGCSQAETALRRAGIPEETAAHIAAFRFCDVRDLHTSTPIWETSMIWPVEPRQTPAIADNGTLLIHCGERLRSVANSLYRTPRTNRPDPDERGFYPSSHPIDGVTAWINFLDQPQDTLPSWARGERTITLIFDDASAAQYDYVLTADRWGNSRGNRSFPSIVISQGDFQIWGHYYRKDKLRPLHPEVQELASAAGFTDQVPYLLGQPYTFSERLGRFFYPAKTLTGALTVPVKDAAA